jgi:hypothetical protein
MVCRSWEDLYLLLGCSSVLVCWVAHHMLLLSMLCTTFQFTAQSDDGLDIAEVRSCLFLNKYNEHQLCSTDVHCSYSNVKMQWADCIQQLCALWNTRKFLKLWHHNKPTSKHDMQNLRSSEQCCWVVENSSLAGSCATWHGEHSGEVLKEVVQHDVVNIVVKIWRKTVPSYSLSSRLTLELSATVLWQPQVSHFALLERGYSLVHPRIK